MATTKIWPVKGWLANLVLYVENPDKTESPKTAPSLNTASAGAQGLDDVINYAMGSTKTEERESDSFSRCFVAGINCTPTNARDTMLATKERFGKDGGIIAYHGYQSFKPGETTPETVHAIGVELANKPWSDRFEVIVTTHLDRGHLHNHILCNSVSFVDGKRFRSNKTTYSQLRMASDELCRKYGLSVIERPAKDKSKSHSEWRAEKEGRDTWRSIIQEDLEQALGMTLSRKSLTNNLKQMGYEVKWGEELSIKPPGRERFMRPARQLGVQYTTKNLLRRFDENLALKHPTRQYYVPDPKYRVTMIMLKNLKRGSLFWLYYYHHYQVYLHRNAPKGFYVSPSMREELSKLDSITRQMKLLYHNKIDTLPQLEEFREGLAEKVASLSRQRKSLYNKAARIAVAEEREPVRVEIDKLTGNLIILRRQLRDCTEIKERSLSGTMVTKEVARAAGKSREKERQIDRSFNQAIK